MTTDRGTCELEVFTLAMQHELDVNAFKGSWKDHDLDSLMVDLVYHVAKLQVAVREKYQRGVMELAADVGNCAMFVADVVGALTPEMATSEENAGYIGQNDLMKLSTDFAKSVL